MKIKNRCKCIFLLLIAEQAAFALPPDIENFCLDYISPYDKEDADKEGTPIIEKGVKEEDSLWLWEKDTTAKSGPNTEYQLNELNATFKNGNTLTYKVNLTKQFPNRKCPPTKLNEISISLKLNDAGIVESIEEYNGIKTDTRENVEKQLNKENRHIALLLADFISTGGKNLLRYKHGCFNDAGPRFIALKDKRANKKHPIANLFNPEFPKPPHE